MNIIKRVLKYVVLFFFFFVILIIAIPCSLLEIVVVLIHEIVLKSILTPFVCYLISCFERLRRV